MNATLNMISFAVACQLTSQTGNWVFLIKLTVQVFQIVNFNSFSP